MKWKRVCMPCYKASVPRRGQSKKIVFLQNADKEINSTMRKILSTDSNVSYFHSAYKGELGFTALAILLPTPPPPPPKKKNQKEKAVVCPNQTEAESLSLVGRSPAKFWIFLLHLSIGCFMLLWKVLGLIEWFSCSKLTYLHPNCPKRPVKNHPIFMSFVLLVMSSVSQTIWHLLAQG